MRGNLAWLLVPVLLVVAAGAHAQGCDLEPSREGVVARVLDGQTVELEGGGTIRLIGALAPEAPGWWKSEAPWRAAERSRAALEGLVKGRAVRLSIQGREHDRHKRILAQLFLAEGATAIWVQGWMVERGLARAYSLPGSTACVRALQSREAKARERRSGIWGDPFYAVLSADDPAQIMKRRYSYEIVEGRIAAVGVTRKWTFLNFGPDYRIDFTVAIAAGERRGFAPQIALDSLEGRRVRVRGWVERWNGPVIKATHPEQIELLDQPLAADAAAAGAQ